MNEVVLVRVYLINSWYGELIIEFCSEHAGNSTALGGGKEGNNKK